MPIYKYRWQVFFILLGILLLSFGIFLQSNNLFHPTTIEIVEDLNNKEIDNDDTKLVVEISGSINKPGVYSMDKGSRIVDAINKAEGLKEDANSDWISKYVNQASPLVDGQKIYFPSQSDYVSDTNIAGGNNSESSVLGTESGKVNVNTASKSDLEALWGIGPATAQKIIDQRMYSSIDELLSKGIIKKNVYERNKDILTIY